jgi:hypothetical protein
MPFSVRPGPFYNGRWMKQYPFLLRASSFAGRAVVFFFVLSALLCFFYAIGNYQEFLDSTQMFLLRLLRVSLELELFCGAWQAGLLVYRNVTEKRPFVARWILLVLSFSGCTVLLVALRFMQQWLQS